MSYSSRTVAGNVKQFLLEVSLAIILLSSLFPARKKLSVCIHPFNKSDQHFRLYSSSMFAKNNISEPESVLMWGGETGTVLCSITKSSPHLKMEMDTVSETFCFLMHIIDWQCQKHWSVYHHQNPLIKRFLTLVHGWAIHCIAKYCIGVYAYLDTESSLQYWSCSKL